jgi:hypothetical protein
MADVLRGLTLELAVASAPFALAIGATLLVSAD